MKDFWNIILNKRLNFLQFSKYFKLFHDINFNYRCFHSSDSGPQLFKLKILFNSQGFPIVDSAIPRRPIPGECISLIFSSTRSLQHFKLSKVVLPSGKLHILKFLRYDKYLLRKSTLKFLKN